MNVILSIVNGRSKWNDWIDTIIIIFFFFAAAKRSSGSGPFASSTAAWGNGYSLANAAFDFARPLAAKNGFAFS